MHHRDGGPRSDADAGALPPESGGAGDGAPSRSDAGPGAPGPSDGGATPAASDAAAIDGGEDGIDAGPDAATDGDAGVDAGPGRIVPSDVRPPQLTHDVIDLSGSYDDAAGRLGDLVCAAPPSRPLAEQRACLSPFRLEASADAAAEETGYLGFITVEAAPVHAASGGEVTRVESLASDLGPSSRVEVRLRQDSAYWLEYLYLSDVQVSVGDAVAPGDVLGYAAPYYDAGFGRVAFGVKHHEHVLQRVCPERYGDASFSEHLANAVEASNAAWPANAHAAICETGAVVCREPPCANDALTTAIGDVDLGRLIYKSSCASCHGTMAEGIAAPSLVECDYCASARIMSNRTRIDMPPTGSCDPQCADDVSGFVFHEFH